MSRIERIKNIFARQVFDSRGNPTIYTRVELLEGHTGVSIVPSGASTGSKEALELRDNQEEFYNGKSVEKAVNNINKVICNELKNRDIDNQRQIDNKLIELDGTENKDNLGANAILGVSMAFARAAAASNQQELHFYLREQLCIDRNSEWEKLWEPRHGDGKWLARKMMPVPMFNVLNGGSHAFNSTDFQEYMIVPIGIHDDIENSMHCGFKIYNELKKQNLEGFNGSLALNSGFPRAVGSNLNMNFRKNKLNFFSTISVNDAKSLGGGVFDSEYFNGVNPSTFTFEDRDYDRVRKRVFLNLGVEYYFNDETSFTISGFTRNSDNLSNNSTIIQDLDQNKEILNEFGRFQDEEEDDISSQLTFNFTKKFNKKGHELVIEFQTEESTEDESDYASNTNTFDQSSITDETQQRKLLQIDYVYPIDKNTQFELGYRGNFSDLNTDYNVLDIRNNETIRNLNLSNIFVFSQDVNAYYTQFGKKINKFSYLLGLRAETTDLQFNQKTSQESNQKKYTDLFPTVNLSYEFSNSENITLGYSRRIRRPRSWSLNPFQSITSLTFFRQGNPDLDPSYSNSYDLGYLKRMKKITFSGSLYFQKETDVIQRITEETGEIVRVSENPIVDVPALRFTSINLSENIRTGTEFTLTYTPKRTVRVSGNFNLFNSETIGSYKGDSFDARILTWFARINSSFPLPLGTNAQINGYYRGPRENAQRKTKGLVGFSGAINKQIFKKKGTISFRASDIFNSQISRSTTLTDSFENYTEFQWRAPTYILTLTYRVNENKSNRRRNSRQYNSGGEEFEF